MKTLPTLLSQESLASLFYFADRAPQGAIVEIGVYKGGSASVLATLGRPLYLYDTFEGMPHSGMYDTHPVGWFNDCSAEAVQAAVPQATVVKGVFPQSLVPMPMVGFVHADGDQYQTTKDILKYMPPLMHRGGFILFDDYMIPDCKGCTVAVRESGYPIMVIEKTGKALVIV